jgi:hypothetical protein
MFWINDNQPPLTGLWPGNGGANRTSIGMPFAPNATPSIAGDGYQPAWWNSNANGSPQATQPTMASILGSLMQILQQLTQFLTGAANPNTSFAQPAAFTPPSPDPSGPQTTFQNVSLSSTGDPHLAIDGTAQTPLGSTTQIDDRYNSMTGHRDLFSTNDFGDHLRVSTTTTQPDANGVTFNESATATMDHGRDSVSMTKGGAISVTSNGQAAALAAGQSVTLSGGAVVTENANGSVSIAEQNANGESLTTTFSNNGSGVDVNASGAGGVTLGGDLVRHEQAKLNPAC